MHADAVAGSFFKLATIWLLIVFFFYSFINETRFTYGRNTVIGIGEGVAEFGLIAADFFGTITAHSTF